MDDEFQPYGNESDVIRVGGLEIENRLDRLVLTGDLVLSRDRAGLALARELHALLGRAITTLESDPGCRSGSSPAGARGAEPLRLSPASATALPSCNGTAGTESDGGSSQSQAQEPTVRPHTMRRAVNVRLELQGRGI